jgi:hypothetical protein
MGVAMIFPTLGPEYYDEKDRPLKRFMESFYAESITINQAFWSEADTDTRFEMGDQTIWYDVYGNLPANRRRNFNFNRIRRVVNMVSGHQRRNRKSIIAVPVENADNATADQLTEILMWIDRQEGVLETISESFHGALVTGMNLLQVWMDYRNDPISGNIRVDNCSYNSFLIDPYFKKPDLSDCNALWKRSFLTKRECISLLPSHMDEILGMTPADTGPGRDGKFQFMPQSYDYGPKNLLAYDEFYYRAFRQQKLLVDAQTGETTEWRGKDEDALRFFLQIYPQIKVIEQEISTVNVGILIQGRVMYDGPNPMGIDCYPFVPVFAYYNPQSPYFDYKIQGMVRGLRDAQYLYNRRRIIELDILESQINSGYKYKENALVNPDDIFASGQGKGLALKEEAQMTDVEKIQPAQVPPSMLELSRLLANEIQEISGVSEELLGSATDDKAGILSMLRQGAGLTTLQGLFDQLDHSQKLLGKIMIDLIQTNFTPGKVQKITKDEPAPFFHDKSFGRYGAAVEEGLNTTTQRQMQFAQMLHLRQAGVPIPDDQMLEASTLQNKNKIIEAVMKQQQAAQESAQQKQQVEFELLKSQAQLAKARSMADEGLGLERISRIQENSALANERKAEAQKDRDLGLLHLVKALKELETLDLQNLERLLALANMVKLQESKSDQTLQEVLNS